MLDLGDVRIDVAGLFVASGATILWLLLLGILRFVRQPRQPAPGPTTQDLGAESPAVAGMLVTDFAVGRQAVAATVFDLAARRAVDVEESATGAYQLRVRDRDPGALTAYEQRVLDLLRDRADKGVVPSGALTTGASDVSKRWWKGFRGEVIDEAQSRGLSRDIWDRGTLTMLAVIGAGAAPLWWWTFRDVRAAIVYVLAVLVVVAALKEGRRQRDTASGRDAAARWLGVRRFHRQGAFEDLPPTAVTIWERHLAYAAAFGVARTAVRAFPMGADDDHRAWSAYGGEWREVRIRYPGLWPPGWGARPWVAMLIALALLTVGSGLFTLLVRTSWPPAGPFEPGPGSLPTEEAARGLYLFLLIGGAVVLAVAVALAVWGLSMLVRGAMDLGSSRQVTGMVLRLRRFGGGENSTPRYFVAVDDGRSPTIRAWRLRPQVWASAALAEYRPATGMVTPNLGFVESIRPGGPAGL